MRQPAIVWFTERLHGPPQFASQTQAGPHSFGSTLTRLIMGLGVLSSVGCRPKPEPAGAVSIVVSGDTGGWIVPCGCTSNQSGGLARRGTFVRSLSRKGAVIVADAGGAVVGTSPYDRAKFEAILAGELQMGLAAHNIGAAEAKLGGDYLRGVQSTLNVPFVSCNVSDAQGQFVAPTHRIVDISGRRIAFVGVLSDSLQIPEAKIQPPGSAVMNLLKSLNGKYDHLIVLAYLPEKELRDFAASLPEADAVIGGPTGQCIAPERIGSRWLASATNKGKFVVSLRIEQHAKSWDGTIDEMTDQIEDDAQQTKNVDAFHRLLADRDFTAQQTSFASMLMGNASDERRIAGSDRCVDCHQSACNVWQTSKHASAWQSLTKTGSQVDAYCQQCHTTGFGLPGGFESVLRSPQRVSVGCEDCHGASAAHVAEPRLRTASYQQASYGCVRCHDRENSPHFSDETYWPRIAHEGTPK